jgi:hypothetical protein
MYFIVANEEELEKTKCHTLNICQPSFFPYTLKKCTLATILVLEVLDFEVRAIINLKQFRLCMPYNIISKRSKASYAAMISS